MLRSVTRNFWLQFNITEVNMNYSRDAFLLFSVSTKTIADLIDNNVAPAAPASTGKFRSQKNEKYKKI